MEIQERLKEIRTDKNLSQKEVADYLKIDRKTYCRYENGHHEIKLDILIQLAKFYRVSLDYLAGLTNAPKTIDNKPITLKNKNITLKQAGDEIKIVITPGEKNNVS